MILHPNIKLNIGLKIISKRDDGFHNIETIFYPNSFYRDNLEIISADDYSLLSKDILEKYDENQRVQAISEDAKLMITIAKKESVHWAALSDLSAKAYRLLDKDFNLPPVKIYLEKLNPVGAGLGGGSSDAAFCLIGLNELFALNLSQEELLQYASKLGSDCSFFIRNKAAFAWGKGDILECIDLDLSDYRIELVCPEGVQVSTAEAYRDVIIKKPEYSLKELIKKDIHSWKDLIDNDFEYSVFKKYPSLERIKSELYDREAIYASMSGSGSAFYAIFPK